MISQWVLSRLNWGDVPTWIASIGTLIAISVALWEIVGERGRSAAQERRSQAELISAWYAGDNYAHSDLLVRNASEQPVHEVVVALTINGGAGRDTPPQYRKVLLVLPPGTFRVQVPSGWRAMSAVPGAEVSFTDRTGNTHWLRRADGVLTELDTASVEHYGIERPFQATEPTQA